MYSSETRKSNIKVLLVPSNEPLSIVMSSESTKLYSKLPEPPLRPIVKDPSFAPKQLIL